MSVVIIKGSLSAGVTNVYGPFDTFTAALDFGVEAQKYPGPLTEGQWHVHQLQSAALVNDQVYTEHL